jgi:hypothetical protein
MSVNDLMKRLSKMNPDTIVVFVDNSGGWANLETIIEKENIVELSIEDTPVFSN